ncbi:5-(carboxyamino)imidazole ribonucleotide synthase [Gordonia defluvii]|uniref:N5-carboxyaminoimidazole ribonucleotide synthase n=2 Tax=Gordoniaceae TaxID=85026 RepID=A0ABP6LPU8_9ACTN|nr:5-(carboxyamino)imidazole ribonucleotide synthase [Gordonia sp. UBA5067]
MPVVTMVGGGQLARMTHQSAIALGQCLRVLAASEDDPAAQVSADVVIGSHERLDDLRRSAAGANVLTFDHEGVPVAHLEALEAEGVAVRPPSKALRFAQDKLAMRTRLTALGLPVPDFADLAGDRAAARGVLREFGAQHRWDVVLKAVRGGYDGRGVWLVDDEQQALDLFDRADASTRLMVEARVSMRRELSALIARSPFGQGAAWPVVETIQRQGQCAVVVAPAPGLAPDVAEQAQQMALRLAEELGVIGVMAMELFETADGGLVVNELAMRPHNSGHWSMDGAITSQFEQHLRAILDYPLGPTDIVAGPVVMANVLGAAQAPAMSMDERVHHLMARLPEAKLHLYGKGERPDRKIGHVNIVGAPGASVDEVRERAERAATWLSTARWTDGWDVHGE